MSGSERTSKTEESKYIDEAARIYNITGIEGILTNYDLYNLGIQLDLITENMRKKGKGKAIMKRDSRIAELLK